MASAPPLKVLRGIISELRHVSENSAHLFHMRRLSHHQIFIQYMMRWIVSRPLLSQIIEASSIIQSSYFLLGASTGLHVPDMEGLHELFGMNHPDLVHSTIKPLNKSLVLPYIMNQYRKYQVTDEKLCLGQDEVNYLAQTYLCYLSSIRQYKQLYAEYHGKGDRSIEESANLVGLRLPKQYKENEKDK